MTLEKFKDWCMQCHEITNHKYDNYLPYRFHLEMVAREVTKFHEIVNEKVVALQNDKGWYLAVNTLLMAAYGHDLIEDARVNYHDIKEIAGYEVAEIVLAVTDCRGRNRKERHSEEYWGFLTDTPEAPFIKICDRLANVRYSALTNNTDKLDMYRKEYPEFRDRLYYHDAEPMFQELEKLLDIR